MADERSLRTSPAIRAGAVALILGGLALCGWQIQRDQERNAGREAALRVAGSPVLVDGGVEAREAWRIVSWRGHYVGAAELVSQRMEKDARGYGLIQRFERENGQTVWVDRGWIPADDVPARLASAARDTGPTVLEGQLRPIEGAADAEPVVGHGGARIWPPKAWASIQATTPASLPWYVVAGRTDGGRSEGKLALDGFEPVPARDNTSLHYASQWLAVALVGVVLLLPASVYKSRFFSGG